MELITGRPFWALADTGMMNNMAIDTASPQSLVFLDMDPPKAT
jgi:hypothetical protein